MQLDRGGGRGRVCSDPSVQVRPGGLGLLTGHSALSQHPVRCGGLLGGGGGSLCSDSLFAAATCSRGITGPRCSYDPDHLPLAQLQAVFVQTDFFF